MSSCSQGRPVAFRINGTGTWFYERTLEEGEFLCPREGVRRNYRVRRSNKWITLLWIPVIPLGARGIWTECRKCKGMFGLETVTTSPTAAGETSEQPASSITPPRPDLPATTGPRPRTGQLAPVSGTGPPSNVVVGALLLGGVLLLLYYFGLLGKASASGTDRPLPLLLGVVLLGAAVFIVAKRRVP
jgi:hypothetical protein